MALVGADGNPIAAPNPGPAPAAAAQPLIDVNQLRTAFGTPRADIPIFYGDSSLDNVSAKFLFDRIKIARTTYGWTDQTTAGNFRLALRGPAIDWLNFIKDTLGVNIANWSDIEPEFIAYYNITVQTVDNVWDMSKLKHEGRDTPAKLMLEVSKLINNVGATAAPFLIPDQAAYTKDEVTRLVSESTKQLKNHLMKTVYINKLQPEYKEYVLSKDPATLQDANNLAVALWRRKNPEDIPLKPKSIFSVEAELGIEKNDKMTEEERQICIDAIRNNRNKGQSSRQSGGFTSYNGNNSDRNSQQSKPKKDKKKKDKDFNTIKCWFCNKPGHTQIECFSRKNQGKPLTWRNKEIKSKFHNNKIFALIDLDNVEEMKEWTRKIEEEAKLSELPKDFQ